MTPEQFPIKMFNVELLLSSNQVDGSQGKTPRDKEQMDKLQRRVKQSKRNLTKALEGFSNRVTSYKMNYPTDDKMEVISTKINDAHSVLKAQDTVYVRHIKLEDDFQNLWNDMEQSEDELDRSISESMNYEKKFLEMSRNNAVVLERCKTLINSLTQSAPVTKFNDLDRKMTNWTKIQKHTNLFI